MKKQLCFLLTMCFLLSTLPGRGANQEIVRDTFPGKINIAKLRNKSRLSQRMITPQTVPEFGTLRGNIVDPMAIGGGFQNIFEMIQGRVPGVWVTGGFNYYKVRVRASMGPPLVVIDGMPFYGRSDDQVNSLLMMIPPADVEFIEVLRNIGQTAIYGPGGGNGVIVVHLRKGEI